MWSFWDGSGHIRQRVDPRLGIRVEVGAFATCEKLTPAVNCEVRSPHFCYSGGKVGDTRNCEIAELYERPRVAHDSLQPGRRVACHSCRVIHETHGDVHRELVLWGDCVAPIAAGPPVPDYSHDIAPLLKNRCVRCHGPAVMKAKLNLAVPTGVARGGEHGRAIVAGKPEESALWQRVAADEMPEDEPLPDDEKEVLRRWIAARRPWLAGEFSRATRWRRALGLSSALSENAARGTRGDARPYASRRLY